MTWRSLTPRRVRTNAKPPLVDGLRAPAPLVLHRQPVEALGDRPGDRFRLAVLQQFRMEGAEDRRLLGDIDIGQPLHHRRHQPPGPQRLVDPLGQILARHLLAGVQREDAIPQTGVQQVFVERAVVLQIHPAGALFRAVERRLRDVEIAALDQRRHLAEEEGQKQGSDVAPVDIRVGHDDDLVVAQLLDVEILGPDSGAERGDQRTELRRTEHFVETRPLHVQDLAAQRQDRLERPVARLLRRPARRIALDDEDFGTRRIAFLAIRQLAGQRGEVQRPLAPGQLPRLARGLAGDGGFDHLADDSPRLARVFLEPVAELLAHHPLDRRAHLRRDPAWPWSGKRISGRGP